jgi:cysteine-rich repeat protein
MLFDSCRLQLTTSGRIDGSLDEQTGYPGNNEFHIRESMIADGGSVIVGKAGSQNTIRYRDAAKPPSLNGVIDPSATLIEDASLQGCPVCGNDEIDQGETCDDGNTAGGDGCDAGCQIEP